MDRKLISSLVAEFGLDLLKLHDEIRLGTLSAQPHFDNCQAEDIEYIKDVYAGVSKTDKGRAFLEIAARAMSEKIQECILEGKIEDLPFIAGAYDTFLTKQGIDVPAPGSADEKELRMALAQAAKLAYMIEQERVYGIREESDLQHRVITRWEEAKPEVIDSGIPISKIFKLFKIHWEEEYRTKRSDVNEYRINRKKRDIDIIEESMVDHFCRDVGIKELEDDAAKKWRSFHIQDNDLKNSAMNKYTEHLASIWKWAVDRQRKYVDYNPWERLHLPVGVQREKTRQFSDAELQVYFNILADTYLSEGPEYTWLPLIIAYQGMRNNEIAQLYVDDIQDIDGITYFRIDKNETRKQRIKADASKRNLPIHPVLIELGFLNYKNKIEQSGQVQLFPNCKYNERTGRYYCDNFSTSLNEFVDLVSSDPMLRVYSLRSNFKTVIDTKISDTALDFLEGKSCSIDFGGFEKFLNRAFDDVMGHATKGTTGDTIYRKVQLRLMKRIVDQVEYPIDISKLKAVLNS